MGLNDPGDAAARERLARFAAAAAEASAARFVEAAPLGGGAIQENWAIEVELRHLNMDFALTGPARFALPGAKASRRAPKKPARSNGGSRRT